LHLSTRRPQWGFLELIFIYLGVIAVTMLFDLFRYRIDLLSGYWVYGNNVAYFILGFFIQFATTIGLVFFVAVVVKKARLADLGIKRAAKEHYLKYGLLGGVLLMLAMLVLGYPINYLRPDLEPQLFEEMLRSIESFSDFASLFLIGAVLAPLSEELFYRGMVYPVFRWHLGPTWGAVLAGLIFGLAHWDLWRVIPLAFGGAILCYIYEKTGSIIVSIITHGVWNGIMSLLVYFSINNWFPV